MAVITRQLPTTNVQRHKTLNKGKLKHNSAGASSVLSTATVTRLLAIVTLYNNGWNDITDKRQAFALLVQGLNDKSKALRLLCKHFLQVFMLAVERGHFAKADLEYFNLDITNPTLPDMDSEEDLTEVARIIVEGDAERVSDGGTAMAMPTAAEVAGARTVFMTALGLHTTAKTALKDAQVLQNSYNTEADSVIKQVWGEVELRYTDLPAETMRDYAREWGVIYVTRGVDKTISGTVKDTRDMPVAGIPVRMGNGTTTVLSGPDGNFTFSTVLMGSEELWANQLLTDGENEPSNTAYQMYTQTLSLTEDVTSYTVNVVLQLV